MTARPFSPSCPSPASGDARLEERVLSIVCSVAISTVLNLISLSLLLGELHWAMVWSLCLVVRGRRMQGCRFRVCSIKPQRRSSKGSHALVKLVIRKRIFLGCLSEKHKQSHWTYRPDVIVSSHPGARQRGDGVDGVVGVLTGLKERRVKDLVYKVSLKLQREIWYCRNGSPSHKSYTPRPSPPLLPPKRQTQGSRGRRTPNCPKLPQRTKSQDDFSQELTQLEADEATGILDFGF